MMPYLQRYLKEMFFVFITGKYCNYVYAGAYLPQNL